MVAVLTPIAAALLPDVREVKSITYPNGTTSFPNSSSNLTEYTFSGVDFGAAEATREIFVVVRLDFSTSGNSVAAVTIGGISATLDTQVENKAVVTIAQAEVPTGTTGDVIVTAGGSTADGCTITAFRVSRRSVAGAASADQDSYIGTASGPTTSVLTPAGGFAFVCAYRDSGANMGYSGDLTTYLGVAAGESGSGNFNAAMRSGFSSQQETETTLNTQFSYSTGPAAQWTIGMWSFE